MLELSTVSRSGIYVHSLLLHLGMVSVDTATGSTLGGLPHTGEHVGVLFTLFFSVPFSLRLSLGISLMRRRPESIWTSLMLFRTS